MSRRSTRSNRHFQYLRAQGWTRYRRNHRDSGHRVYGTAYRKGDWLLTRINGEWHVSKLELVDGTPDWRRQGVKFPDSTTAAMYTAVGG